MPARLPTRSPEDRSRKDHRDHHRDRSSKDRGKDYDQDRRRRHDEPVSDKLHDKQRRQSDRYSDQYTPKTSEKTRRRQDSRPRSRSRSRRARSTSRRPRSPLRLPQKTSIVKIPAEFKQDDEFLDSRKIKGFALPRYVASTSFTEEIGIAGASTLDLPVAAVVLGGLDNWGLRFVASGQRGYWTMSRTYRESQLFYGIGQGLKDNDLDSLASAFARTRSPPLPFSTNDEKKAAMVHFSAHVVDLIAQVNPQRAMENRIQELEAENARLVTSSSAQNPGPTAPSAAPLRVPAKTDPLTSIQKTADKAKFLAKSAPSAFKARDITTWIKKITTHPDQRTIMEDITNSINDVLEARTGEAKAKFTEDIRAIATEWGLPFGVTGSADIKLLIKFLAATATVNM